MLNSTCINPKYNHTISYRDYKVHTTPLGLHNGSAILVKRQLKHSRTKTGDDHLLAVTIGTTSGLITFATFYRPFDENQPNSKIPHMLFNRLFNRSHPVILMGDLNLKHKCLAINGRSNKPGIEFAERCLNNKNNIFYLGPNFNTWFDRGKKSKCDIILGNKASHELNQLISQGKQLGSDHTAVHLRVSSKPICIEIEPIPDINLG